MKSKIPAPKLYEKRGFPSGSVGKESACNRETQVWSLGQEGPLEKGMATHSSGDYHGVSHETCLETPMDRRAWQAEEDCRSDSFNNIDAKILIKY